MASSELLQQIQSGKSLKKAQTNDRSAPVIDAKPSGGGGGGGARPSPAMAGPPQLGGLFAGGMPKLKSTGQSNLAKAPSLGKPPSIPRRDESSPGAQAPTPPNRNTSVPKPAISSPAPPTRIVPAIPRTQPQYQPTAPVPPPVRSSSPPTAPPLPPVRPSPNRPSPAPPVRPSPALQTRSAEPSQATLSSISRPVPAIPPRSSTAVSPPRKVPAPPTTPGRAAPPPPPRPSSAGSSAIRTAPSLPARKVTSLSGGVPPAPPARVRAVSEADPTPPPRVGPSPARSSLVPPLPPGSPARTSALTPPLPPGRRLASLGNANGTSFNGPRRKIPSPPASAGPHTFPVSDFPPPRTFSAKAKVYGSGRQRGSDFNLGTL